MKERKIKILLIKPNQQPIEETVDNTLEKAQELVGGYIEALHVDKYVLICNEEGKLNNLPPNRIVGWDIIVGDFFLTKSDVEGNFISLTNEDVEFLSDKFKII